MKRYFIYRMKDAPRETFRWTAHTGGLAVVRAKDYDVTGEIEAPTPYAAWKMLAAGNCALRPGDVLECANADGAPLELQIAKYIGFEPAKWFVPEPKSDSNLSPPGASDVAVSNSQPA